MGFDPGTQGGVCVVDRMGSPVFVHGLRRKMTENQVVEVLTQAARELLDRGGKSCVMEKVRHIRGDGGKGSFTFGGSYKFARAVLLMHGITLHDVLPMSWMVHMNCLTGGDKTVTLREAKRRWPEMNGIDGSTADAVLIARYGWEVFTGWMGPQVEPHL